MRLEPLAQQRLPLLQDGCRFPLQLTRVLLVLRLCHGPDRLQASEVLLC